MIATRKTVKPANNAASAPRGRGRTQTAAPAATGRGRRQAVQPAQNQPVRGRQAQTSRPSNISKDGRKAYFGNAWLNVSKYSQLTDEQVANAYQFIDEILLPNFYIKMTVDSRCEEGIALFPGNVVFMQENRRRVGTNPNTGKDYIDADLRASLSLDGEVNPTDYLG